MIPLEKKKQMFISLLVNRKDKTRNLIQNQMIIQSLSDELDST